MEDLDSSRIAYPRIEVGILIDICNERKVGWEKVFTRKDEYIVWKNTEIIGGCSY